MKRLVYLWAAVVAVSVSLIGTAGGADLPKSGSFTIHSGWKSIGEMTKLSDDHMYGVGSFWGVTYNDAGNGPLHTGPVVCPYTLEIIKGAGTSQGSCAWGDAEGDRIFTSWSRECVPPLRDRQRRRPSGRCQAADGHNHGHNSPLGRCPCSVT